MNRSYIFLSTNFEEIEALTIVDILRRAEVDLQTVSMEQELKVMGSHGVPVVADVMFDEIAGCDAGYLILPGGSVRLNEFEGLKSWLSAHYKNGGRVAAICAAPMVLGGLGILEGKRATAFPGFEDSLIGATLVDQSVVADGTVTTGNGPGASLSFALELVKQIRGEEYAAKLSATMCYPAR